MKPRLAKILSERLAKDVGGAPAVDEPVPLPGTVHFKLVGAQLQGRFPVQFLPLLPTAYRIVDGELVWVQPRQVPHALSALSWSKRCP